MKYINLMCLAVFTAAFLVITAHFGILSNFLYCVLLVTVGMAVMVGVPFVLYVMTAKVMMDFFHIPEKKFNCASLYDFIAAIPSVLFGLFAMYFLMGMILSSLGAL